jgi:CDP-diacylglycerol--glycerol-3-phosphate 3-phosphatidyltransferase
MDVLDVKAFTNSPVWIIGVFSITILSMGVFGVLTAVRGMQRSTRVQQAGGSVFLNQWIMEYGYWWLRVPSRLLIRWRVSPNAITLGGFGIVFVGMIFTACGYFGLGGPILLVGSLSDMLDGIVARERKLCSDAGEFVDAIVDRYADIGVLGALCIYYQGLPWAQLVVLLALLGSVMVSYARAKAEALSVNNAPGGPMRRAERAVYLGFSVFLGPLLVPFTEPDAERPIYFLAVAVCAMIAVVANISAIQMSMFVTKQLRQGRAQ